MRGPPFEWFFISLTWEGWKNIRIELFRIFVNIEAAFKPTLKQ